MGTLQNLTYKSLLIVFCSFLLALPVSAQNTNEPWVSLFNGENLDGWKVVGSEGVVRVNEGAITCNMVKNTPEHTFACTTNKYADFILELEVKADSFFNSGVLFRSIDVPRSIDTSSVRLYGYMLKIDPSPRRKWTGGIFDDFGRTWHWLYTLANDERAQQAYFRGEWNKIRIEAIGSYIKTWVNGVPAANLINKKYKKGYIAFKIHSLGNEPEKEKYTGQFRNIRIITRNPEKYSKPMDINPLEVF